MPTILSAAQLPTLVTGDVGYKVLDSNGDELIARTNAGVVQSQAASDYAFYQASITVGVSSGVVIWDDSDDNFHEDKFNVDSGGVAEHTTVLEGGGRRQSTAVKASGEKVDIEINWADALAEFAVDEVIASSAWSLTNGTITVNATGAIVGGLPAASKTDTTATMWVSAGTEGTHSEVKNTVTTNGGRVLETVVTVWVIDRINPATAGAYCSLADVENIFGCYNVYEWAKIEDVNTGALDARIIGAIGDAEDEINARLRSTRRYAIPFPAPIPRMIARLAATLAGLFLYESRGVLDVDPATGTPGRHRYAGHKKWAADKLDGIASGKLQLADDDFERAPAVLDEGSRNGSTWKSYEEELEQWRNYAD